MVLYLQTCFDEAGDDAAFIAKVLGTIARAKGMTQLARDTGLGRESLYKALSGEGNPQLCDDSESHVGTRLVAARRRETRLIRH